MDASGDLQYGGITPAHFLMIFGDLIWKMRCWGVAGSSLTEWDLLDKMARGWAAPLDMTSAMILGFRDPAAGGNHVMVAYSADLAGNVFAMDPRLGAHITLSFSTVAASQVIRIAYQP